MRDRWMRRWFAVTAASLAPITLSSVAWAQAEPEPSTTKEAPPAEADGGNELDALDISRLIDPEVRTASLIAEPVSEAPAPVTVITADMIEALGARNLQEVLSWYVPGMTIISDKDELNIAMRGIYTDSQQKLLILVDGHRVNSRVFSSAAPDFGIGIQPSKIQQIEVLRGPGSALYGNLALNGVVNIVTKDTTSMHDASLEVGIGTMGQRKANAAISQKFGKDTDVKVFGSFYSANGDEVTLPPEEQFNKIEDPEPTAILGGWFGPPAYDVSGALRFQNLTLSLGTRHSKWVPPFTAGDSQIGGQTYEYDEFRSWNNVGVGFSSRHVHSEISYDVDIGKWVSFHTGLYYDTNATVDRGVIDTRVLAADENVSNAIGWQERSIGNLTHLTFKYDFGSVGAGSLIAGGQIDNVKVLDSYWITGSGGDVNSVRRPEGEKVLPDGNESTYSGFTQLKHAVGLNQDIIFNLGVRYDYKARYDYQYVNEFFDEDRPVGDDIFAVSPRTALILAPESWLGFKFSFSDSFVDAPYFYRTNRTRLLRGTPELEPERMRAYQVTPTLRLLGDRLRNSTNFFYLEHKDIIFRNKDALENESIFQNSGQLVIGGVENEITFLSNDYRLRASVTYQKPFHETVYPVTDGQIDNVPLFFAAVVADLKPLYWMTNNVWLGLGARYYSAQTSPIDIFYTVQRGGRGAPAITAEFNEPDRKVDGYMLLRATLRWKKIADTNLYANLTVDDILGTTYYQGGTTAHPYRQPGRWFLFDLGYDFDL